MGLAAVRLLAAVAAMGLGTLLVVPEGLLAAAVAAVGAQVLLRTNASPVRAVAVADIQ